MAVNSSDDAPLDNEKLELVFARIKDEPATLENLTLRSQILRYQDRYVYEEKIVNRALEKGFSNDYFTARAAWFAKPRFDRFVARRPLDLPKDPALTPGKETLDRLCIVTALGSDQPYYHLGIELIESIRNTRTYRNTPICILDTGLTEAHKQDLLRRFGALTIKDPGLDLDVVIHPRDFMGNPRSADGLKGCLARPFIQKHFPGYRYYLWFDTDTWIQDERTVDTFVSGAVKYGVCSVVATSELASSGFSGSWWHRMCSKYGLLPDHLLEILLKGQAISAGTFCIDLESGFFDHWAAVMKELVEFTGQVWGPDELSYMLVCQTRFPDAPVLGFSHNFKPDNGSYGPPIYGKSCLLSPQTAEPLGIIHLCGPEKGKALMHLIESDVPVDLALNKSGDGLRRQHSVHFRVWPWEDKPELGAVLKRRFPQL